MSKRMYVLTDEDGTVVAVSDDGRKLMADEVAPKVPGAVSSKGWAIAPGDTANVLAYGDAVDENGNVVCRLCLFSADVV